MKLAEALVLRADYQKKIEELKNRLLKNAKVQEGDTPYEDPAKLLKELDKILVDLSVLIKRINKTNSCTLVNKKKSIADLIVERDNIATKRNIIVVLADSAVIKLDRYSKSEIKYVSAVNISELQKTADMLSKQYRETDTLIQETNWKTELMEL
jgi:hypothetical protein